MSIGRAVWSRFDRKYRRDPLDSRRRRRGFRGPRATGVATTFRARAPGPRQGMIRMRLHVTAIHPFQPQRELTRVHGFLRATSTPGYCLPRANEIIYRVCRTPAFAAKWKVSPFPSSFFNASFEEKGVASEGKFGKVRVDEWTFSSVLLFVSLFILTLWTVVSVISWKFRRPDLNARANLNSHECDGRGMETRRRLWYL